MVDCSRTANFLKEQSRMCIKYRSYPNACRECPLSSWNNKNPKGDLITCCDILSKKPQRAIRIVQGWSNANPPHTIMTELLKKYPNTSIKDGVPDFCPSVLGLTLYCNGNYQTTSQACIDCWSKLVKESEVK